MPGHFHFYLLLGLVPMVLAFMYYLIEESNAYRRCGGSGWVFRSISLGGLAFAFRIPRPGANASVPRRFAVHLPEWIPYDRAGSIGAVLLIAAMLVFTIRIIAG